MQSSEQRATTFPHAVANPLQDGHAPSNALTSHHRFSSSAHALRSGNRCSRRRHVREWLCSLSTLVTGIYFALLVTLAVIVATTTRVKIDRALQTSWGEVQRTKCSIVQRSVDSVVDVVRHTSVAIASLYTQSDYRIESNETLAMLCATLAKADPSFTLRALVLANLHLGQYASSAHGDPMDPSMRNISVLLSNKNRFYGVFYVNPDTYEYDDPPQLKGVMDQSLTATQMISAYASTDPLFSMMDAIANGTLDTIPPGTLWNIRPFQPSLVFHTLPVVLLGRNFVNKNYVDRYDFVQVRMNGSALLGKMPFHYLPSGSRAMILANATLSSGDPIIMSNNWLQAVVHNASYTVLVRTNTFYLKMSNISDPLMREAVKHINLSALQHSGYTHTTIFRYRHAPAMVTAMMHKFSSGLELPIVVTSSQASVTGPVYLIADICIGMLGVAVVLLTALCYFAMDRYLARPLRRVTAAMDASVRRGVRQPVCGDACDTVQLAETRALTAAYNGAMAQLRVVDEFVPGDVRSDNSSNQRKHGGSDTQRQLGLRSQYLTVLTVHIRPSPSSRLSTSEVGVRRVQQGGTLVPATAGPDAPAAIGAPMTNHGPFATAADLEGFVAAVLKSCADHSGVVHRLTPDFCVLHFGAAASNAPPDSVDAGHRTDAAGLVASTPQSAPPQPARATQRLVSRDALDALAFGFALLHWADKQGGRRIPDIRLLADTGVFACGRHKAAGSEQTLSVAFGRDVDRSVGHIPAKIGVRLAMTEETANYVRTGLCGGVLAGVRQLPVEALRTGRVGLDANVVILYEALPGAAVGSTTWQRYADRSLEGFSHMLRGDYATALSVFREVADIVDLEPGLIPARFRREGARTSVKGGAVSSQVERLMCECERRMATHWTQGFHRTPIRPLGMDVVLSSMARERLVAPHSHASDVEEECRSRSRIVAGAGQIEKRRGRYGLDVKNPQALSSAVRIAGVLPGTAIRTSYTGVPPSFQDNWGKAWHTGKTPVTERGLEMHARALVGLSASGTMGAIGFHLYRDVPPIVSAALDGVAPGPMSDAARKAVPFWLPSPTQREAVHKLFGPCLRLRHPNVLACLGYSIAHEGGVVVVSEFVKGGSLRELRRQFPGAMCGAVVARLGCSMMKGLMFLHVNGIVHGELRPECVLVCSDGVCRLKGFYTNYELAHRVLCLPRTCYVSPEVAAGLVPTTASDVFGFGLVMLELISAEGPWVWAPVVGEGPQRSSAELATLMNVGGDAFSELVAQRLVMPAVDHLDRVSSGATVSSEITYVIRRCLEWRAEDRLTLKTALCGMGKSGRVKRSHKPVQHSLLHFGDSDEDATDDVDEEEDDDYDENVDALIQIF